MFSKSGCSNVYIRTALHKIHFVDIEIVFESFFLREKKTPLTIVLILHKSIVEMLYVYTP